MGVLSTPFGCCGWLSCLRLRPGRAMLPSQPQNVSSGYTPPPAAAQEGVPAKRNPVVAGRSVPVERRTG